MKPTSNQVNDCIYRTAGIIFVSVDDPYSRLIRSISKSEYSAIGFYAPSTSTGCTKVIVTLVDLFGLDKPTWLSSGCTLDRLVQNPLVTRLAIKPLRDNSQGARFRSCICRGSEMVKKPTLEETIFSLFGYYPNGSTRCTTGVDLVNRVVTLYGHIDKIQPGCSISLSALDELQAQKGQDDHLALIGMMGLPFAYGQDNVDISSYIIETELFGELIEIPLPHHDPVTIEIARKESLQLYRPYLTKGISTFLDLILTQPDFLTQVTKLLKEGKRMSELADTILVEQLASFSETLRDVMSFISSLQDHHGLDAERVSKLKDRLNRDYFTSSLYLHDSCRDVDDLKRWTQDIIVQANRNESSCRATHVDMNELISIVSRLSRDQLVPPKLSTTPSILIWSKPSQPETCRLRSGKVIYLNPKNPNLDSLSGDELIQISNHLNHLDESYDSYRHIIADQLSLRHEVS